MIPFGASNINGKSPGGSYTSAGVAGYKYTYSNGLSNVYQPQALSSGQSTGEILNLVPMKHNSHYNVNQMLATNILNSSYFRGLYQKTDFQQVLDEIFYKVDNVEPFLTTIGSASNSPSTAFCLLYKLFTMKLTRNQMNVMLGNGDSPYIRALGFLYLRYTCPPQELWSFFKSYVHDDQEFPPTKDKSAVITIGQFVSNLLKEQKFYGTLLPRIPKMIELDIGVELMKKEETIKSLGEEDQTEVEGDTADKMLEKVDSFEAGDTVKARYSQDGKWYVAEIIGRGKDEKTFIVKYVDYDDEEEEVALKFLKMIRKGTEKVNDEELKEELLRQQREKATTGNRNDYAKKISTFKNAVSVPLSSKHVSKEIRENDHVGASFKSVDDALEKLGRIGELETERAEELERKERKRKERQEQLEKQYGNAARKQKHG